MFYFHISFAVAFDKVVWNSAPVGLSVLRSGLVLGRAIYVAVLNDHAGNTKIPEEDDEESSLVINEGDEGSEESSQRETGPPNGSLEIPLRTMRTYSV